MFIWMQKSIEFQLSHYEIPQLSSHKLRCMWILPTPFCCIIYSYLWVHCIEGQNFMAGDFRIKRWPMHNNPIVFFVTCLFHETKQNSNTPRSMSNVNWYSFSPKGIRFQRHLLTWHEIDKILSFQHGVTRLEFHFKNLFTN